MRQLLALFLLGVALGGLMVMWVIVLVLMLHG